MNILLHRFGFQKKGGRRNFPFPVFVVPTKSTWSCKSSLVSCLVALKSLHVTSFMRAPELSNTARGEPGWSECTSSRRVPVCSETWRDVALGEEERTLGIILRFLIRLFSISFALNSSIVFISSI